MTHIEGIAGQLQHVYEEGGPGAKAQHSLARAGMAFTEVLDTLGDVGKGSEQSELQDSTKACERALSALDGAKHALAIALSGVAAYRDLVLGNLSNTDRTTGGGSTPAPGAFRPSAFASTDVSVKWAFRDQRGLHLGGRNMDSAARDTVSALLETRRVRLENLQRLIDTAPNFNEQYAEGLASVQQYFAERGLEIAPVVVLGDEDFDQAQIILSGDADSGTTGFFAGTHLIVRELSNEAKELLGPKVSNQFIMGTTAHEGTHSVKSQPYIGVRNNRGRVWPMVGQTGLHKMDLRDDNRGVQGSFFEEGCADYVRVQFLTSIDQTPRMDGHAIEHNDVTYVGRGLPLTMPGMRTFDLEIPAAYARAATVLDNGRPIIAPGDPGIAGYGVELIDSVVPGFAQTLLEGKTNPAKQAEAIKMINSLDPNLYRQLRSLPYAGGAFVRGLRMIGDAVKKHQSKER